jgi:hypothetical protein
MINDLHTKIKLLIQKSKDLIVAPTMSDIDFHNVEGSLQINFSIDFKKTNSVFRYDYFLLFDFFNFQGNSKTSVVQKTLRLRQNANLPLDTLILSEDDASVLLMKCLGDHEEIYWIAVEDYENYCEGKPLEYNPTIFPTFTDFFAYLLDEEEKKRKNEV